jgi:hypothetical protein
MVKQGLQCHIKSRAIEFIQHLLGLTHKQWLFRNARTHIRLLEWKSKSEHDNIMDQVGRLLFTDPTLLLPQHIYLLELNFKKLGAGSTTNRQYWLANLESAVKAFQQTTRIAETSSPLTL